MWVRKSYSRKKKAERSVYMYIHAREQETGTARAYTYISISYFSVRKLPVCVCVSFVSVSTLREDDFGSRSARVSQPESRFMGFLITVVVRHGFGLLYYGGILKGVAFGDENLMHFGRWL